MEPVLEFVRQHHEADDVTSFFFLPRQPLSFVPGQYIDLSVPHAHPDSRGISRSLTVASAPSEPLLQLTTRIGPLPSTFKQALSLLMPGDVVQARGPYGTFVHTDTHTPAVFIAGGIGITPFRSMLAELASRKLRPATSLLYSNARPDIPFRAFFDGLTPAWPELHAAYTVTRPSVAWSGPTGRIDAVFIRRYVRDLSRSMFFVCGPSGFVDAMAGTLDEMGLRATQIKREGFPGYEPAVESARVAVV
jgi:glycine betaine catabolism B